MKPTDNQISKVMSELGKRSYEKRKKTQDSEYFKNLRLKRKDLSGRDENELPTA